MQWLTKRRRIWIFYVPVFSTAIGLALLFSWPYSTRNFRGDGEIRDTGFWSYPRYHIRFSEVRLDKPGEYVFTCSGLPPVPLTFQLSVIGDHKYNVLKELGTDLEFRMTDVQGREVCRGSGPLKEWVLRWGGVQDIGGFWQPSAREITVRRSMAYRVNLSIRDIDPASPIILARPMLEGGGNELP